MTLKQLFQNNKTVLADGATGTYFSQITGLSSALCEKYNVINPDIIRQIHCEYIASGAKIIRTNTFSANSFTLGVSHDELSEIIKSGYVVAAECARDKAVVCANVSALYENTEIPRDRLSEYKIIVDSFIECGAKTFIFETLSELDAVMPAIDYILTELPDAEIITSFTVLPDGHTRSGISLNKILESIVQNKDKLTMVGLNCGCGTAQLYNFAATFFSYINEHTDLYTSVMPNAGYPSVENQRTVFTATPVYFAGQTARFCSLGVSALGGCCGTNPEFIRLLGETIENSPKTPHENITAFKKIETRKAAFSSQLTENRFVIAAELDPPNNADLTKLLSGAEILKNSGVDIITVSDSPLGHAKMDSVVCSARIKREVGIDTLPHICCRDKNINALRSALLGAYSEGIRAVLAVTGDHIAETDRGVIKPVFNIGSTQLMTLIHQMNEDVFAQDPVAIGGAFDPMARNPEFSLKHLDKKIDGGATFVLTQPVFSEKAIPVIEQARSKGVKVLVGIMPMVSYRNANFMKNEVPGMTIPQELVDRFKPDMTREQSTEVGVQIASELCRIMRPHADGFYFVTPFNRAEVISAVLDNIRDII
ncbi:MAG: bifunctional homocysteine S-methyltransferase/methylenetetrahydrofolate reductase [Acutalibacteraceae bacterium]